MAEKRTIELEIQDNSKSLKQQYREAVQELQKVSQQYGETSEQAAKAARAAAELKDQIAFSKDLVGAFNPDAKFKAVEGAISGVMNGFQAFEGGLALLGVESDKVQEALLRVQSVMALTQGINGILEAKDAFSALGTVAKTALKGIKTELIATGIGAFAVAIGSIAAYWDDIKGAVSGVSEEQEKLNKKTDANLKASEEKVEALDKQDAILKLQGKSEKDILKLKIAELDVAIKNAEINVANQEATKVAQVEAAKRNKSILEGIIIFLTIPLQTLLGTIDLISEGLVLIGALDKGLNLREQMTSSLAKMVFDPEETAKEGDEAIKAAKQKVTEFKNQQAQFKLDLRDIDKNAAADRANTEKASAKESLDLTRERIDKEIELMEEGEAKEKRILEEKARREKEDLAKSIEGKIYDQEEYAKTQKLIEDNLQKGLQSITDKYDKIELDAFNAKEQERFKLEDEQYNALQKLRNSAKEQELLELAQSYDAKFEAAKNNAELEKALTDQFNKEQAAIIEKYRKEDEAKKKEADEKEKARIKALSEFRLNAAKDTLQMVSDLTELFAGKSEAQQKKAFQIQKAVNIANAVIDTYKAANTALASSPPPFNYIAMAAAITAGLLNVKKIASQKFQASGSSGGGGGGGGSNAPAGAPMTANFSTIGSSGINQLAQLQQKPTQAYVVSGEVTSAQALDRNRVQNATL